MNTFKRLNITENEDGSFNHEFKVDELSALPENDLIIKVHYSSLNFKDALSSKGNKGVTKKYPHTPGIDAAGEVYQSNHADFKVGDKVIITGHDLGMNTLGGFSEYISVPADWALHLPENLSLKESMIIGTAGLTAAMCIDKMIKGGTDKGKVIISGASGGVGSMAIMILHHLGFETVALSRKETSHEFLKSLGADAIVSELEISNKPVLKPVYNGGIDAVGGEVLSSMLKQIMPYGSVSICGMALSPNFSSSVFPFIIRGISMFGVDSAEAPNAWRKELWHKLANDWKPENLEAVAKTVELDQIWDEIETIYAGKQMGRVVVKVA